MRKLLLITWVLVFQSFSTYGNSIEKGIICKFLDGDPKYEFEILMEFETTFVKKKKYDRATSETWIMKTIPSDVSYLFKGDSVIKHYFTRKNDLIILNSKDTQYDTETHTISWKVFENDLKTYKLELDRESLKLDKRDYTVSYKIVTTRQCSVWSVLEYETKLDDLKIKYQENYDKLRDKNKI